MGGLRRTAFLARGGNHLLEGQRFELVLTSGEKQLSKALREFVSLLNDKVFQVAVRETAAWPEVERMLINLGYNSDLKCDRA